MDMDELKLIADTIQHLGDNGTTAFVWWLVLDKLVPATLWAIGSCVFMYLCWRIAVLCTAANKAIGSVARMRDLLGLGSGMLIDREIDAVEQRVRELHRKEKENAR